MRVVIQRVKQAHVSVDELIVGKIQKGMLVFLGVSHTDTRDTCLWMINKILQLRIFADEAGKMNRSLLDIQGQILVVSQFTLYGNCTNGRRPDFFEAAPPVLAESLYDEFCEEVKKMLGQVETGQFGALMEVSLVNDGPVTFVIER